MISLADVAVLIPDQKEPLLKTDALPQLTKFYMGQEAYFLGYPYGLVMQASAVHLSAALVKHAYISAVVRCSDLDPGAPDDKTRILLDGFNNPGFSGGPVVSRDLNDPNRPFKVVGIISGFRFENIPVSVNGQKAAGASVQSNTGIIWRWALIGPLRSSRQIGRRTRHPKRDQRDASVVVRYRMATFEIRQTGLIPYEKWKVTPYYLCPSPKAT